MGNGETMSGSQGAKDTHARSFGAAAIEYARGRPSYPEEAVEWLVPASASRVLDLGAGTGLFTRLLAARGLDVVVVEPAKEMLAQLTATVENVEAHEGSAESIPLPDASVDAVVVAQAWHWVDLDRAVPEVARVLRPGGMLGLVWNVRDETVDWVAQLGGIMQGGMEHEMFSDSPPVGAPFGEIERRDFAWSVTVTRQSVMDLVASRSYFIVLPPDERAAMLRAVRDLLSSHPALVDRDEFTLPYVTRCSRAKLT